MRSHLFFKAKRVGFYLAFDGEIDLAPLMQVAAKKNKIAFLPVIPKRFEKNLKFSEVAARGWWQINRYGIREFVTSKYVRAWQLDVVFLPLVAFDEAGSRLGMGAGYYDISLSRLRFGKFWRKPRLIGVAFECQKVAHVPTEPWDIKLDMVITEKKIYRCTGTGLRF